MKFISSTRIASTALTLIVLAGADCGMSPIGSMIPGTDSNVVCLTTFFDNDTGVGFNAPAGLTGPVEDTSDQNIGIKRFEWFVGGDTFATFSVQAFPFGGTLQEAASIAAQILAVDSNVVTNEATTVNSGLDAWLLVAPSQQAGTDLITVQVIIVEGGMQYTVQGIGVVFNGTNNVDFLVGAARTLCADPM